MTTLSPSRDRRAYWSVWYAANRERVKARSREWALDHPDQMRAHRAAWSTANASAHNHARRAQKQGAGVFLVTPDDLRRLVERWRHTCAYCGAKGKLTWDHVVPITRGGRHSIGNILPACLPCNLSKGPKLLIEWRRWKTQRAAA